MTNILVFYVNCSYLRLYPMVGTVMYFHDTWILPHSGRRCGGSRHSLSLLLSFNRLCCNSLCSTVWFTFWCFVRFVVLQQYLMPLLQKSQVASFELTTLKYAQTILFLLPSLSFSSFCHPIMCYSPKTTAAACWACMRYTHLYINAQAPEGKVVPYSTRIFSHIFLFQEIFITKLFWY